ncbi:MAG TPA: lytic murein transglycosylase B [Burkholderiaceae bacterium]|nr:lytic murein transglycosylase B [Burkholderiaceae bacterium]HQR69582.1 lytic murein transglycosylase B [Burkholderiaceae bacterium]
MKRRAVLLSLLALAAHPAARAQPPYPARSDVQQFIDELVTSHGFERASLQRWLQQARYSASVERLMQPAIPFAQRNWLEYRDRYIEPARIAAGVTFWQAHAATAARAEQQYGVPAEIIVAIIGIETYFGRITGNFRTLDVFATLAFDYLRRADFYRGEFIEFLLLAREQAREPASYRGSFAGAIGLPQFMPGSIRRWAVDFDGDGRIDLLGSPADAIGSVANFLVGHGWERGQPIAFEVSADEAMVDALGRGIEAGTTWSAALNEGVTGDVLLPLDTPVLLIDLPLLRDGQPEREFRIGTVNFSAILQYNRSYFYATAVTEFAAALRERMAGRD